MKGICGNLDIRLIRSMIREWIKHLASRNYQEAADYLSPIPGASVEYTADAIKSAIGRYSRKYREAAEDKKDDLIPNITDPQLMDLGEENMVIYTKIDNGEALVEYDIPIDGEWSDLTASFILLRVPDGIALGLHDMHVL